MLSNVRAARCRSEGIREARTNLVRGLWTCSQARLQCQRKFPKNPLRSLRSGRQELLFSFRHGALFAKSQTENASRCETCPADRFHAEETRPVLVDGENPAAANTENR